MAPWLALGLLAGVTVHADPATEACAPTAAVAEAVEQRVRAPVHVRLVLVEGDAAGLSVELRIRAPRAAPFDKRIALDRADCALLPRMVALVVERWVRALPARTWAPRAPPEPLAPEPRRTLVSTPVARYPHWSVRTGGDAGASLGTSGTDPGLRLRAHADLARGEALGLTGLVSLTWVPDAPFGPDGRVRVVRPTAGLAGFGELTAGSTVLRGELGVHAGAAFGQGFGFERASAASGASGSAEARVSATFTGGWYAGAAAEFGLIRTAFTRDGADAYREAAVRFGVFLGFSRAVAFF